MDNLVIEYLKKIQAEQSEARQRDAEIMARLAHIESSIVRIARDETSNFSEIVHDRHTVDRLKDRIERIEKRLDLSHQD